MRDSDPHSYGAINFEGWIEDVENILPFFAFRHTSLLIELDSGSGKTALVCA